MGDEQPKQRDGWEKLESFAKAIAAFGGCIAAILIPVYVNDFTQQNQRASVYGQIMTEREKADTDLRRAMFTTLLEKYLGGFEDQRAYDENLMRKRIMFLDLLNLNFQDYLNAKPLFEDVYERLERAVKDSKTHQEAETIRSLQNDLIEVGKRVASKQAATLTSIGVKRSFELTKGETICVRLYNVEGYKRRPVGSQDLAKVESSESGESCNDFMSNKVILPHEETEGGFPSIQVRLEEIRKDAVRVEVTPYKDFYREEMLVGSVRDRASEFEASYFDLPYMDNTKLFDGSRFALVLSNSTTERAQLIALRFKKEFMSVRDRPVFEEMLQKLQQDSSGGWLPCFFNCPSDWVAKSR